MIRTVGQAVISNVVSEGLFQLCWYFKDGQGLGHLFAGSRKAEIGRGGMLTKAVVAGKGAVKVGRGVVSCIGDCMEDYHTLGEACLPDIFIRAVKNSF